MFLEIAISTKEISRTGDGELPFGHPLEKSRYFKSFIACIQVEAKRIFGSSVTDHFQVTVICQCTLARIDFSVVIWIYIFHIASLPLITRLKETKVYRFEVFIHFTVGSEEVIGLESPDFADIHSLIVTFVTCQTGMIIVKQAFGIIIFRNYSLIIGNIEPDTVAKATFQSILPVDR